MPKEQREKEDKIRPLLGLVVVFGIVAMSVAFAKIFEMSYMICTDGNNVWNINDAPCGYYESMLCESFVNESQLLINYEYKFGNKSGTFGLRQIYWCPAYRNFGG